MSKRILMIVTSHSRIDDTHETGIWFEEFSVPYNRFLQQGYAVTVMSPAGGDAPLDANSLAEYQATEDNERAQVALKGLPALNGSVQANNYDAVFFPGGHGTMFDLPDNPHVQRLIQDFYSAGKPVASVCHGPACLVNVSSEGVSLVKGRKVTAFTDSEERVVQLDQVMPFLLETRLRELGAVFVPADDWADNTIVDGHLITGQNPQSSGSAAEAMIKLLED
ncbi:MAG: type 1 glutamine amidotransferase domain-containing protein [Gammaproteobacteria bacterium]|nr:type 1 glutamine amidotransferase domain-containing protein [Gammaproteobacteria bacterium]